MTRIQDKITYYDGSVATGKIVVTWPPFDYGGTAIAAGQQEYPIAPDGTVVIDCYPCVGAQPIGTYYTATYELDRGATYDEYWLVPSAATTTIGAIRVSVPATPSIMINAQQLTSSGAQSGMFLGWSGSGWVPMYPSSFNCAVRSFFGRTGDVMPLTGDYTVAQVTNAVPDARRVIAGSGLSGGGPLTADVTISLSAGGFVPPTRQILAGYGLTGGGPLSADVTLSVVPGMFALQTTRVIAGAGLSGGGPLTGDVTLSIPAGTTVPPTTQVIAGFGLTGGGPLSGNVTLAVLNNASIQKLQLALAGALKATRHQLNFVAGSGVNINLVDDGPNDQGTLTITAVSTGAPSPSIFSVNGVQIGSQVELNLIASAGVTLAGVNNNGAGRVDVTVSAAGGGQTPWLTDIDAGQFDLNNLKTVRIDATNSSGTAIEVTNSAGSVQGIRIDNSVASSSCSIGMRMGDLTHSFSINRYGDTYFSPDYRNCVSFVLGSGADFLWQTNVYGSGVTNQIMRLTNAGKLGIGASTTLTYQLEVAGDVNLTGGVYRINGVPIGAGGVTSVFTRTGAVVALATDYSAFYVPLARQVIAGTGLTGGGALSADVTLAAKAMVASGASHSAGMVPDPGATAGVTKFLREDATWAVVSAGASQTPWTQDIDGAGFRLLSAGAIGVGTANPGLVGASVVVSSDAINTLALVRNNATDETATIGFYRQGVKLWTFGSNATFGDAGRHTFGLYDFANSAARLTIDAAGNVGIGTTNPFVKLQVVGSANFGSAATGFVAGAPTIQITQPTSTETSIAFWQAGQASAAIGHKAGDPKLYISNTYSGSLGAGVTNITLTHDGNVGIGTTSPQAILHAQAPSVAYAPSLTYNSAAGFILTNNGVELAMGVQTGGAYWMQARLFNNAAMPLLLNPLGGNVGIGTASPSKLGSSTPHAVVTQARTMLVVGDTTQNGTDDGLIQVGSFGFVSSNNWNGITMLSRNLAVKSVGNTDTYYTPLTTGIGYAACVLNGAGEFNFVSSGSATAGQAVSPNPLMVIQRGGNVGIGTTSPSVTLELAETGQPKIGFYCTTGNANQQRGALIYDGGANLTGGGWTFQRRTDAGGFSANLVSIIASNGRVGIMTTTPACQLDVAGSVNATGNYLWNSVPIASCATRNDVTGSRTVNQTYGNPYGRPMLVNVTSSVNSAQYMQLLTDGGNPPSTLAAVVTNTNTTGTSGNYTVSAFVMPGHYFQIFLSGGSLTKWIEWA